MYPNLKAEMARRGVLAKDIAVMLGVTETTISNKINGKFGFSLKEAMMIRDFIGADMTIDQLFEPRKRA